MNHYQNRYIQIIKSCHSAYLYQPIVKYGRFGLPGGFLPGGGRQGLKYGRSGNPNQSSELQQSRRQEMNAWTNISNTNSSSKSHLYCATVEDRGRITKQSSVFPVSRCPLSTLERECFQLATKCIIVVDRSSFRSVGSQFHAGGAATEKALVADSSTCPLHDEVARRRSTQCRSSWHDVGDRCQQVSDVFWRV